MWARRCVSAGVLLALLAAGGGGCTHSTAVFAYERRVVWQAAIGECVIWRPELIDEENFRITSTRIGLGGVELKYELRVDREPSLPARPRSRVYVRMAQTKPTSRRFVQEEKIVLRRIGASLEAVARRLPPPRTR